MENNRHAYLIMAYNNWNQLSLLLSLLDDARNDIYVHIDRNSGAFPQSMLENSVHYSSLTFIPRKKVFWADYSQTDVELDLLTAATEKQEYRYYHLLSGMDLPLKTQNEIHSFFDRETREFIGLKPDGGPYAEKHARYYRFFLHNKLYRKSKPLKALDWGLMYLQRSFSLQRKTGKEITIATGWTWFSITDKFARRILSQRDFIENMFSHTLGSDELFIGTMVNKLGNYEDVYHVFPNEDGTNRDYMIGSQRYVDFDRPAPHPYTWGREDTDTDFKELMQSGFLFARKFDEKVNNDIILKIYNCLMDKDRQPKQ